MNDSPRLPDPRMIPASQPQSWFEPSRPAVPGQRHGARPAHARRVDAPVIRAHVHNGGAHAADRDGDGHVRPFIVTGGRTVPLRDGLRIDTLVEALPKGLTAPLQFEQRRIVELAQSPMSVAEVAARVRVPLGVARVLISDLYGARFVSLYEPTELPVRVIERIRDLVRAL
jgi:hypothetical protein